jgi:hypothetical protein
MSDLDSATKPLLGPMLRGHARSLHEACQRTLATWAVKTRMVASSSIGAARRVASPQEHRYLRDRGERNVWSNTLTIGPVVFQVVGTDLAGLIGVFELRHPYTHQLWPFVESFVWMPQPCCSTEQLIVFADSPIDNFKHAHGRSTVI